MSPSTDVTLTFSTATHLAGITIRSSYPIYGFYVFWTYGDYTTDSKSVTFTNEYQNTYTYQIPINEDNIKAVSVSITKGTPYARTQAYYVYPRFNL